MIFKSPEELVEFFNKLDLEKSNLVFKTEKETPVEESDCACGGTGTCQCPTTVEESVTVEQLPETILVESFSESPQFKIELAESGDNIFYVSDYESIPDACGTGMVELPDRKSYLNMCEMEGVATVNLNVVVEGQTLNNVSFRLAKTDAEPYIVLNKKHINS